MNKRNSAEIRAETSWCWLFITKSHLIQSGSDPQTDLTQKPPRPVGQSTSTAAEETQMPFLKSSLHISDMMSAGVWHLRGRRCLTQLHRSDSQDILDWSMDKRGAGSMHLMRWSCGIRLKVNQRMSRELRGRGVLSATDEQAAAQHWSRRRISRIPTATIKERKTNSKPTKMLCSVVSRDQWNILPSAPGQCSAEPTRQEGGG